MPTRRFVLFIGLAAACAAPAFVRPARADASSDATAFITTLGQNLIGIVNGSGTLADKQAALTKIIDRDVDVSGVARFCLGRFWRIATPAEQQDYLTLFHAVLVKNITGKLGDYTGVTFSVGGAQPREDEVDVTSTVTRPGNPPDKVEWLVGTAGGSPKVVDVIAEGTSLRLTQRSDYSSYLSSHGNKVQALIDAMRQQASK